MTDSPRMHPDEVDTDSELVRRLIAEQHPRWSSLPIAPVLPRGTDNALYRLGIEMVVRLPRRGINVPALRMELEWLPRLAPHLPFSIPEPLATGVAGVGFPFPWTIYRWIDGLPATPDRLRDERDTALDLARFIVALRLVDAAGGPPPGGRGGSLAPRDAAVRRALEVLGDEVGTAAVLVPWEAALRAPAWDRPGVWVHGDLDARNVLANGGRIRAVVDFGALAVGDPACDVMVAWKMLSADTRSLFRTALDVDEATWTRARGWALSQALIALGYYTRETNAVLVDEARRWLHEVLSDG